MMLLRKIWTFYKIGWQEEFEYRFGTLVWIINQWVGTLFIMFLWYYAAKNVSSFPLSPSEVITYFLLSVPVSRLTQSWSWQNMEEVVRNGEFTKFLLRPISFLLSEAGENLSRQSLRLLTLLPVLLFFSLIWRDQISIRLEAFQLLALPAALVLGLSLRFLYDNFMGVTTFWLLDVHGFSAIVGSVASLFSGSNIPLAVMPPSLLAVAKFLPFRFFVSFPLEIVLGQIKGPEIFFGFLTGLFWLLLFAVFYKPFLKRGIRVYEAVGI